MKPDFIAIGPEKTGTTLLYAHLKQNPQVSLPPAKEIRYWNEGELIPSHSLINVLTSRHWHYKHFRVQLKNITIPLMRNIIVSSLLRKELDPILLWKLKYLVGKRGSAWYNNLFAYDGKVTGDISPLYYHIPESQIKKCHKHNPNTKVIVFVRNPIDRVWSKARMNLLRHKGRRKENFDMKEFQAFAQNVHKDWRPYKHTIQAWKSIFANVHVAFYDELQKDPKAWYRKICEFLKIEINDSNLLRKRVGKGIEFEIPRLCELILFQQYGKELRDLGEFYNLPYWLRKYDELAVRYPKAQLQEI